MKRVPTGIKGFDQLVQGGFPEKSSQLLCGAPGTGKSIFGLQFLYNGAKLYGENGLYVSVEEDLNKLREQAAQFGWNYPEMEAQGRIKFLRIPIDVAGVDLVSLVDKEVKKLGIKRVVVDSLSIISINAPRFMLPILRTRMEDNMKVSASRIETQFFSGKEVDQFIYVLLTKLNGLGPLILYVADAPPKGEMYLSRDTVSEFVCDGVIQLKMLEMGNTVNRTLEIKKMRNTAITAGINTLSFEKTGITISKFEY